MNLFQRIPSLKIGLNPRTYPPVGPEGPSPPGAAQGQHELEEDQAIDLHRASPDGAGTTGGEQDSARDGTVKAAEDDLGSSKSEMSDIDVRSRQERESGGFFRGVRARVRSAFGDG